MSLAPSFSKLEFWPRTCLLLRLRGWIRKEVFFRFSFFSLLLYTLINDGFRKLHCNYYVWSASISDALLSYLLFLSEIQRRNLLRKRRMRRVPLPSRKQGEEGYRQHQRRNFLQTLLTSLLWLASLTYVPASLFSKRYWVNHHPTEIVALFDAFHLPLIYIYIYIRI